MGIGIAEGLIIFLMIVSTIWVFNDAPKHGINKYLASLVTLFFIYPVGFIAYLIVSRLRQGKDKNY